MVQLAATLGPLDEAGRCPTCRTMVATTSSCPDIVIELHRCVPALMPAHPCHHFMLSHPLSLRPLGDRLIPAQHSTGSSHAHRSSLPDAAQWAIRRAAAREWFSAQRRACGSEIARDSSLPRHGGSAACGLLGLQHGVAACCGYACAMQCTRSIPHEYGWHVWPLWVSSSAVRRA